MMELSQCFVCGKSWSTDQDFCIQCHTAKKVLLDIVHAHSQAQFLFGRMAKLVKPAEPDGINVTSQANSLPISPESTIQGVRAKPREQPPLREPRIPEVRRPSSGTTEASKPNHLAFFIDLACCALLDTSVFFAIQIVSSRTTAELLRFSLVPIILVLISFSVLYFWLFLGITQKTFGQILTSRKR